MKIQKGILNDLSQEKPRQLPTPEPVPQPRPITAAPAAVPAQEGSSRPVQLQKDRLFETLEKEESAGRNYLKLFVIAVVIVLAVGGVVFYLTLPKAGDIVHAPKGAEDALRAQLLEKQKRESEDIIFYYCGDKSYWARADVKIRKDLPNPVFKIGKYAATVKGDDPNWEIASKPIVNAEDDNPCS